MHPKDQQSSNSIDKLKTFQITKNNNRMFQPTQSRKNPAPQINPLSNEPYSEQYFKILKQRQSLPAFDTKDTFVKTVRENDIVIVQGETGSGKTTQLPQFLMEELSRPGKMVAVTQPRRVAAISVAKRVADETDTKVGNVIGYSVRFNECVSRGTRLKYMTDGMLLSELMSDPNLGRYGVIVLDEAHERGLQSDILLALLKKLINQKRDQPHLGQLKLVVMSATIEIDRFVNYFEEQVPVLSIPGRCFPVEIYYTREPEEDYLKAAVRTAVQIHTTQPKGDVLVFLTGEDEITQAVADTKKQIHEMLGHAGPVLVLPLFSAMSSENQQKIFSPAPEDQDELPGRKIIYSTNIAETSLTIDGIVYVVDPGLSKQKVYNPRLKIDSLLVAPISRASAKQRAGRAGRTRPGKCFRLYTEESYKKDLKEFSLSDIVRSDLSSTLLKLKSFKIDNLIQFDYIEPPSPETMFRAIDNLVKLGVLEKSDGTLTNLGRAMSMLPLEPKYAKVLFSAARRKCFSDVLSIISVISSGSWRLKDKKNKFLAESMQKQFFDVDGCDLMSVSNVFKAFENAENKIKFCKDNFLNFRTLNAATNVKKQLLQRITRCSFLGYNFDTSTLISDPQILSINLKKSFLEGFYANVAHLQNNGSYQVMKEDYSVLIHPSSALKKKKEFVLYLDLVLTSRNYMRMVSPIEPMWLFKMFPQFYSPEQIPNLETKVVFKQLASKMSSTKFKN
jgi:pre-mRNA-splicing factor ATP-dependent RNA helicase DHX15/PRP43